MKARAVFLVASLLALVPALQPRAGAQLPAVADDRFADLQWRFVRIRYHFITEGTNKVADDYYGEPWYIDAPAAEQNLSRRVKTATTIQVEDPIVLTLDDPRLFTPKSFGVGWDLNLYWVFHPSQAVRSRRGS